MKGAIERKFIIIIISGVAHRGEPTVLLKVGRCVQDFARPPCLVADCRTAAGLSLSAPPALASSSASHSLSAAQRDEQGESFA